MPLLKPASRLLALDYLRGYFIVVIIIDHLWRWPNIFEYVTGRGELWVSAAEGFVIISGLLLGYVRGWKNRHQPLATVSGKLVRRGLMLYLWMVITTLTLVVLSWLLQFKGNIAHVPFVPWDWSGLLAGIARLDYVHTLTHFLYLYAIFLILSPLAIWLLRHNKAWIVAGLSALTWVMGMVWQIEWLQWQILFFVPVIAGYYLEPITHWFGQLPSTTRRILLYSFAGISLAMLLASAFIILPTVPGSYIETIFTRDPLSLPRVILAFICFVGFLSLTTILLPLLKKFLGWLLPVFGERSLTGYIVHIIPLMICQFFIGTSDSVWFNSLLVIACVLATWAILKIPGINRVIPR